MKPRPLTVRYETRPPNTEMTWLETAHFLPPEGETVLLVWARKSGFTFRTGRFIRSKWRLSGGTEPRENPTFFAPLNQPVPPTAALSVNTAHLTDEQVLITDDGVGKDEKRRALAAILARHISALPVNEDTELMNWLESHLSHTTEKGFSAFVMSCAPAGFRVAIRSARNSTP